MMWYQVTYKDGDRKVFCGNCARGILLSPDIRSMGWATPQVGTRCCKCGVEVKDKKGKRSA